MNIEEILTLLVTTTVGISLGSYISSYLIRRGLSGDVRKIITEDLTKIVKDVLDREDVKKTIKNLGEFAVAGKEFFESEEIRIMTIQAKKLLKVTKDTETKESLLKLPEKPK